MAVAEGGRAGKPLGPPTQPSHLVRTSGGRARRHIIRATHSWERRWGCDACEGECGRITTCYHVKDHQLRLRLRRWHGLRDENDIDDLAQETWSRVLSRRDGGLCRLCQCPDAHHHAQGCCYSHWGHRRCSGDQCCLCCCKRCDAIIMTTAKGVVIDEYRRRGIRSEQELVQEPLEWPVEENLLMYPVAAAEFRELERLLEASMLLLSEEESVVLICHCLLGLSVGAIATRSGRSRRQVNRALTHARCKTCSYLCRAYGCRGCDRCPGCRHWCERCRYGLHCSCCWHFNNAPWSEQHKIRRWAEEGRRTASSLLPRAPR